MNATEPKDTFDENIQYTSQQVEELVDSLATYRALIEASNTGAWEYFTDSKHLNCNHVYYSLLGYDLADFVALEGNNIQRTWVDFLHPDDLALAMRLFEKYVHRPVGRYENAFRMRHKNGHWVWIWSRGCYIKDSSGNNTNRIIGTHVDITRHKLAEEQMQRERILLRTLIDNLPDTIYVKDEAARKVISNKADVRVLGATAEQEVLGKTDLELYTEHIDIGKRGYADDMRVLSTGEPIIDREEFFWDEEGNKNWLLTSKVPVRDVNGNIISLLGIGHNITKRKKAEEELKKLNAELNQQSKELSEQAEELKVLNEQMIMQQEQEMEKAIAQGKFEIASEVLHDIGNALVGFGSYLNRINRTLDKSNIDTIKGLNQFLASQQTAIAGAIGADKTNALITITDGISKTQVTNKDEISNSVWELVNIITHIQEILNIQRQFVREHGEVHERKPVNLISIIDDCRSMLMASFEKKGIRITINAEPGSYVIKGDHTKLMQVMLNVLKNSVEAIKVDATDKKINVQLNQTTERIKLVVNDNGEGFDSETGEHLFERGFTTKKSGTGLGLYNCRSIVESHAGSFEIASAGTGKGATTTIQFFK
ncbi:PAS domain S-box protein [Mucilaginibacter sp. Bleaf8]|uniref:PAS domain S-box protein n=1 Tax=Mucilaginibacter sp. Bleaf8 TaxID=2834430 RepID=UPI001BCFC13C|nr:PAS domain S-box protein [Mucilaginibacter sp. Bleaf8]MBS7562991.1 PAS domain S-box protein [Mucilaginibacter sp. Bleaf8]